jgi:hypothetical protein
MCAHIQKSIITPAADRQLLIDYKHSILPWLACSKSRSGFIAEVHKPQTSFDLAWAATCITRFSLDRDLYYEI